MVNLLVAIEKDDMIQVFASPTRKAGNVGGIDIGSWDGTKVVLSPLVFQVTLSLFLLLSFFIKGLAFLETQEMCVQEDWRLVLSLSFLEVLILRISSQQGLGLGFFLGLKWFLE